MLSIVLSALLAFSPQGATVHTADGGRLRGTVLESGAGGVTVLLADGSTRRVEAAQVSRIDFADGTFWKPGPTPGAAAPAPAAAPAGQLSVGAPAGQPAAAPQPVQTPTAVHPAAAVQPATAVQPAATAQQAAAPVPAPAPAPAAAPVPAASRPGPMLIPLEKLDTVHFGRGGRLRCLVLEEGPDGVVVRLVDGSERRYGPGQVTRIDWADGTRSDLSAASAAPAAR